MDRPKLSATPLDKWTGEKNGNFLMRCEDCNVTLCIKLYQPFHIDADVVENKEAFTMHNDS